MTTTNKISDRLAELLERTKDLAKRRAANWTDEGLIDLALEIEHYAEREAIQRETNELETNQ